MTRNITIKDPSPKVIRIMETLKERKLQQSQRLREMKECTFSIKV